MVQKVCITLEDDIDRSVATETISFGLDGENYLIDLNEVHAAELRDALAIFVSHGRKLTTKLPKNEKKRSSRHQRRSQAATIRDWAKSMGYEVSERGRLSSEVHQAYGQAHTD